MTPARLRGALGRVRDALKPAPTPPDAAQGIWPYSDALRSCLEPGDDRTFLQLLYFVLLGRPIDNATLDREADALARGTRTRAEVIDEIVSSLEFKEAAIVQAVLAGKARLPDGVPAWPGTSERVVELPWVLQRTPSRGRLLDVGYAWASWVYIRELVARADLEVHGTDPAVRPVPGLRSTRADARCLPYRDNLFDVVTCVSTIEHVGRDNDRYGIDMPRDPKGDTTALSEFGRVLIPGGVALLTIPMGEARDHGWFVQYDRASWSDVVRDAGLVTVEQQAFRLTDEGWNAALMEELDGLPYGEGAPGARGVLCTTLSQPS